ncbi:MAG: hypothetical protein QOD44_944 [Solirubrobacteraceae bacterium]|nr:hypothetical protein [Solirubrobacteraceae bacterium]MEA2316755.1 hypothetical protein [Solirubrobacteraceae bacterium]
MARSIVHLPRGIRPPFEVYVNGVPQHLGDDYAIADGALVFERELRKDKISKWRWFVGAWGVGTYRQDDSVDVRYERADGSPAVAEKLDIELEA